MKSEATTALRLVCLLAVVGLAQAQTLNASETVLHNFPANAPKGSSPEAGVIADSTGNLYGTTYSGGAANYGVVFKIDSSGRTTVLHNFMGGVADGISPRGGVMVDGSGNLYGTTAYGGAHGHGIVYKLDSGGNETTLYSFTGGSDGGTPEGSLLRDAAGNLYGTAFDGGIPGGCYGQGCGVVYKLQPSGQLQVLYTFTGGADGGQPTAGLMRDSAGSLYGVAAYGALGYGVVFKVSAAGEEQAVYNFTLGTDGGNPNGPLIHDASGNLYGTAGAGGEFGGGVVYKLDTHFNETTLYEFGGSNGAGAEGGVVRDAAGNLYGTTLAGGPLGFGVVFKVDPSGVETVLYSFTGDADGYEPQNGVIRDANGNLYGTAQYGGAGKQGTVFRLGANDKLTVLLGFPSATADGSQPFAGLLRDAAGNLYGTTAYGGTGHAGTVYKINAAGQETVLHNFTGGTDGGYPMASLISDPQGNLYGTTEGGGPGGGGVVFMMDPAGNETVLCSFSYYPTTGGALLYAGVVRDSAGYLYGTAALSGPNNAGVVFKVDPVSHQESVLYSFTGGADGGGPWAGVVLDAAGNLYGTTNYGGTAGFGVVFKLDRSGKETVLHNFTGGSDGTYPFYPLARDSAGVLYGATPTGGTYDQGVVYKLDPATQQETVLYAFTGGADGGQPNSVTIDPAGNIYGTAFVGGQANYGVVFRLDPSGKETVLHSFQNASDGGYPTASVLIGGSGLLYGTTSIGGTRPGGVVYQISPR